MGVTATLAAGQLAKHKKGLEAFLTTACQAEGVDLEDVRPLTGGAIQENWLLDLRVHGGQRAGAQQVVLRTDARSGVAVSRTRAEEFALLKTALAAGVTVPEPLWLCEDQAVMGKTFYVMA